MKYIFVICFILAASFFAFAQTDDSGVSKQKLPPKSSRINLPKPQQKKQPIVRKKEIRKSSPGATKTPKVLYAGLTISVNKPNSEIFMADGNDNVFVDAESYVTDEYGSPLQYDEFPVGTYTLTIRKYGFFDDKRQITVIGGRTNNFTIELRPKLAFLSVSTNVDGANIVIENVGEFENQISDYPLAPGTYRLSVSKNGYKSETREVVLNKVGEQKNLVINLSENPTGIIGSGGKVRIAVKMQINGQLLPGDLIIERNRIVFTGKSPTLNFIVTRGNAVDFVESEDSSGSYIEFKAHGIFNSKQERNKRLIRLYPNPQDAKSTFQLLESWRVGDFSK
jgi:hypothetical protein